MIATIITFLLKIGMGGIVDKTVDVMKARAATAANKDKMQAELIAEHLRQTVEEVRIMADFNKAKLRVPWFWAFAALFIVPLGAWWAAVIADSIFGFSWSVANLPTPQMQEWAGEMIRWLFYTGATVAGIKAVLK